MHKPLDEGLESYYNYVQNAVWLYAASFTEATIPLSPSRHKRSQFRSLNLVATSVLIALKLDPEFPIRDSEGKRQCCTSSKTFIRRVYWLFPSNNKRGDSFLQVLSEKKRKNYHVSLILSYRSYECILPNPSTMTMSRGWRMGVNMLKMGCEKGNRPGGNEGWNWYK